MPTKCPNCDCGDICEATNYCEGCDSVICFFCYNEHNKDWNDHTEHVAVMRDRRMTDEEIRQDFDWHAATGNDVPNYNAIDDEEGVSNAD